MVCLICGGIARASYTAKQSGSSLSFSFWHRSVVLTLPCSLRSSLIQTAVLFLQEGEGQVGQRCEQNPRWMDPQTGRDLHTFPKKDNKSTWTCYAGFY
mmetsp:Transcript_69196/g.111556  ORF Transcript_69196/g.111556 Transcript_69196/m.111556 type:complete len:98 (+) Transcript_69196:559-852(+)